MPDTTFIEHLKNEYDRLEGEKILLVKKMGGIRNLLEAYETADENPQPVVRSGIMKAIADVAHYIISSNGRPMHRSQLLDRVEESGVTLTGDDRDKKLMLLSSALSKDARFISVGRGTGLWDIDSEHKMRERKLRSRQLLDRLQRVQTDIGSRADHNRENEVTKTPVPREKMVSKVSHGPDSITNYRDVTFVPTVRPPTKGLYERDLGGNVR